MSATATMDDGRFAIVSSLFLASGGDIGKQPSREHKRKSVAGEGLIVRHGLALRNKGKREVSDRVLDDAEHKLTWEAAEAEGDAPALW